MTNAEVLIIALLVFDLGTTLINMAILMVVFKMYSEWVKINRLTTP